MADVWRRMVEAMWWKGGGMRWTAVLCVCFVVCVLSAGETG